MNKLNMRTRYLDLDVDSKNDKHAETVYDFQSQDPNILIAHHLDNLVYTYGLKAVKQVMRNKLNMQNRSNKTKLKKVS